MSSKDKTSVAEQTQKIRNRIWLIPLAALIPFMFLVVVYILQAETANERLLAVAALLFAGGIAFLSTRLAAYTIVGRYLEMIDQLDDAKSDFISIASHQLKSPVSSLRYTMDVFTDALEEKDWETVAEFSGDISKSVDRLDSLTHKLLDVARADAGRLSGDEETFRLTEKIDDIVGELKPLAKKKGINLSAAYDDNGMKEVTIDPGFLYNVTENLLTNAIDYAPSETTVSIKVESRDRMAYVSVRNTADSVTPEDLENIFAKFDSGSKQQSDDAVGGTGLGLFIAKSYVQNWGGDIGVSLEEDGDKQQVVFTFTVPLDGRESEEDV